MKEGGKWIEMEREHLIALILFTLVFLVGLAIGIIAGIFIGMRIA